MAGESLEMDSLFEGMDFVMPVEDDSQFVVDDGGAKALEATKVAQEIFKPSVAATPTPPSLGPVSLSSGPNVGFSSRPSTTVVPSSQPPSRSLSPTPSSPAAILGDQLRDHTEPLDESLFSGLTLAVEEDETITEFNPESTNGVLTNSTTVISKLDSTEKISMDSIHQHERSRSFDEPSGGASIGNAVKDGGSMESTMSSLYNDGPPHLSLSGKYPPIGAVPTLTRTGSGISSTVSPPVKPSMRRKKRSMKIGYGREDEENEELGLKKAGIRDAFGAALLGAKNGVNSSSSISTPKYGLSRESSHNALSVEESSFALGSPLGVDFSPLNGVELAKENSAPRLSSGSQYSTLEVIGIERLESRDISKEILLQLESERPEVIPQESDIPDIVEPDPSPENGCDERDPSPDNGQPNGSPVEETKSDIEVGSIPPSNAIGETTSNTEVPSEPQRMDPEDTAPSIENESAAPLQEHGVDAEAIIPDVEDDDLGIESLAQPKEGTIEERLEFIKEAVAHTLKALHEKMSAVSSLKKTAVQKRRRAAEKVTAALARYMELEAQLNAACEREDFEKADSVSGMIAEAETSMAQAGEAFAAAEAESDSAVSKVHHVLDLQVAVEEQGATFLEALKQEAEEAAEKTLTEAREIAGRETERLEAEAQAIEVRKKKLDLELNGVQEAREELNKAIGDLTQSESKQKDLLTEKRDQLGVELQDLLKLVRMKEAEIAECDERIADVDAKISSVAANFENQKASLDAELEPITLAALNLEKDSSVVSEERQGIEQLLADAEAKRGKLENSARLACDAAKAMRDTVKIKKSLAVSIMLSRKNRTELAEKEKQAQAEAQLLRQNAASTRVLLQELTSSKVKLGQELGAVKERVAFAEKRAPELDAEKKVAAAARNFKVAGRLAAEAKVLNGEKEAASVDMARITKELETVEGEAEVKLHALADLDNLIAAKEREGATAHCERQRLVAAATRDERDVAIELDDFEEAESLDTEAKTADAEAEALQKLYQLVGSEYSSHDNSSRSEESAPMDREADMAECERLRLVAAAARAEMEIASECDQFDEAEALHSNAEKADAEADRLQSVHQLEGQQFERQTIPNVSGDLGSKDKESAMTECEKLRLLAASARAERDTAVELDEFEGAETFDSKAEAADLEADKLQKLFQLEGKQYQRQENLLTNNQPE